VPSIEGAVVDTRGGKISGVEVIVMPSAGGAVRETITDKDGTFKFDGLTDGTYRIDADLLGFSLIRQNNVRIAQGESPARVVLTLRVGAICECVMSWAGSSGLREREGRVTDSAGRPLPHARLTIDNGTYPERAYADRDGRFRVLLPPARTWPLTVQDSGFETVTRQVASDSNAPLIVTLPSQSLPVVPDVEPLPRNCRCPRDLFTHRGR